MNPIQNNINITSNNSLNLASYQQKYNNLLISYNAAINSYIDNLKNSNNELIALNGYSLSGGNVILTDFSSNLNKCINVCASNSKCNAAIFKSSPITQCKLISGDVVLIPDSSKNYAIIRKNQQLLNNVYNLNNQLIDINNNILALIKLQNPINNIQFNDIKNQTTQVLTNYNNLINERNQIEKLLNEYETLDNKNNDLSIYINKTYYSYILLFICVLIFIIILFYINIDIISSSTSTSASTSASINFSKFSK